MAKVVFNEILCKGCGLCVDACPKKIVSVSTTDMNDKGYFVAGVKAADMEKCIGCKSCAVMCPDCVIEVYK